MPFAKLGLSQPVLEGVRAMGYIEPTPIQLRAIPLILQPVTDREGGVTIPPKLVLELQELASRSLKDVRIIPQTHKFIGTL